MTDTTPLVDFAPALRMAMLALVVAMLPLSWLWLRSRGANVRKRLAMLTALTMFLTFDLIVFGSFTRLTDSGLGCPDWPGCYGQASPFGAHSDIKAAEAAIPDGPVTWSKAWIEMIHRYLAMAVGVLILVMTAVSWRARRELPLSPWWPSVTLFWVIVQGLFGKYTVTWKLYPAIVTAHLLGGIALLALLTAQHEGYRGRALALPAGLSRALWVVLALLVAQIALGGWVSTNYAVLACGGFPTCNGQWWPPMELAEGFTILRELGHTASGALLSIDALVGIHWVHRAFAVIALAALLWAGAVLARRPDTRAAGRAVIGLALLQLASGMSNVVLDWPIVAALLHAGGAAALAWLLCSVLARTVGAVAQAAAPGAAGRERARG